MPADPRSLSTADAADLLNSTPLGQVIDTKELRRHRAGAVARVAAAGDLSRIDLVRYAAWQFDRRRQPAGTTTPARLLTGYEAMKDRARARSAELSLSGRDIGEIPAPLHPARRDGCERNLRLFCETYFPELFPLAWSDDHLKVIGKIEKAVLEGGLFAMAMPRGSGKTTLCEVACLWALLYGHRLFVPLIGPDEPHAVQMLDAIKSSLEHNDELLADFPEVCFPIRALEGIHQRAGGQLYRGVPTEMTWSTKELVFPTVAASKASGRVIRVAGITGQIRGMKHQRADGVSVRPDLVLIDDPQTDESAKSPSQCAYRESIIAGAILGLAGPGRKIAGLMTVTVVVAGDMADRVLDRDKHPQWQGERTKMVYRFPANEKLWAAYAKLRQDGFKNGQGAEEANQFYAERQAKMDRGALIAWPARKNPDELSAVQHAMNLRLDRGDAAFFAEYQNEPKAADDQAGEALKADEIAARLSGYKRGMVPRAASRLTMFIDVQERALFWLVAGWEDDFTGYIVSYGTYPEQPVSYFTLREMKRTLQTAKPGANLEGCIYAGLEQLTRETVGREWLCDDGAALRIERCLIDANWDKSTDVVYQFCRQSGYHGVVMPSHGRYVGAAHLPFSEYRKSRGDRLGLNWRIPGSVGRQSVRRVLFDTNFWKTFIRTRLTTAMGDPTSLTLHGRDPAAHRLLCDHLTSEHAIQTVGRGRTCDEWRLRPGRDNHWWDCLVGCAVAASMQGAVAPGMGPAVPLERKRVSFAAQQAAAMARR